MRQVADFAVWYADRRGREPFPWMERLAEAFAAETLPSVISLPTAAGKSEIVMIWAWARLAAPALPRRLWIASDRRFLVDKTFETAKLLESDGIRVSRLRGGLAEDEDRLLDLLAPQVIATTHAPLAGADSLVVLDEAHLSPNAEAVVRACCGFGADLKLVTMTATPRNHGVAFTLDAADKRHPVLGRRLAARRLVEPGSVGTLEGAGRELLAAGARRIALVANTVRSARTAFEGLRDITAEAELHLLIGRQRPLDRDSILADLAPRIRSGAPRPGRPIVVVTTQAIEAGADLDFEAMASEGCPIDSLIQRLGRLDRLGSTGESRCLLLKPDKFEAPYGSAPRKTFDWIGKRARKPTRGKPKALDLGPEAWQRLAPKASDELYAAQAEPVSLLAPNLRMLTWTAPRPMVEPEINLLLHGPERGDGVVSVIWRRDADPDDPHSATEILRLVLPSALEACPVPAGELRRWLLGRSETADAGDVEGGLAARDDREEHATPRARHALRWRGREDGAVAVASASLRAGDVAILPAVLGGYDAHGWAPNATDAVPDIAEAAAEAATGRRLLRFDDPELDDATIDAAVRDRAPELASWRRRTIRWRCGAVVELVSRRVPFADPTCEVPLADHSQRVAARAAELARALGLDAEVLYRAGLHHDAGKADRRWQIAVRAGDVSRLGEPDLARGRYRRTALDRLPRGWRHEADSLARIDATDALADLRADDAALVRWLVATHHGYARPFWPERSDGKSHGPGLAEFQDRLQARHGPWRVALHEAALRLADRAVSREEAEGRAETPIPRPARPAVASRAPTRPRPSAPTASFAPAFDPLNLRDMMAALGLTRIVSDCSDGATLWVADCGRFRFRVEGAPRDLAARCANWVARNRDAFDFGGHLDVTFGPDVWRRRAAEVDGLAAALWCAIGSDGVRQVARRRRIAVPLLAYANGAGGGYTNWLGSMAAFVGIGANRYAGAMGAKGVAVDATDFARVLAGALLPTLRASQWVQLEARSDLKRPLPLTQSRWDAEVWVDYAMQGKEPAHDRTLQDQTVNALAAIGLASCPSAPSRTGLITPMIRARPARGETRLAWPIWTEPLRTADLEALLAAGPRWWRSWPEASARRWTTERGVPVFEWASLCEPRREAR